MAKLIYLKLMSARWVCLAKIVVARSAVSCSTWKAIAIRSSRKISKYGGQCMKIGIVRSER